MKSTFKVNYQKQDYKTGERTLSHSYLETWESLDLFCPHCGEKSVWHDTAAGDYYVDEQYLCVSCDHSWYMPGGVGPVGNCEQGQQRLACLKTPDEQRDHSEPAPEPRMTEEELVELAKTDPLSASMIRIEIRLREKIAEHCTRKGFMSSLIEGGTIPENLGQTFTTPQPEGEPHAP